jgi:hypothetical protein
MRSATENEIFDGTFVIGHWTLDIGNEIEVYYVIVINF